MSKRLNLVVIIILAGAGLWLSDQLLALHDRASLFDAASTDHPAVLRWCSALSGTASGCEKFAASSWSELTLPIFHQSVPVALLGWCYFAGIGIWYLAGAEHGFNRWQRWVTPAITFVGLFVSLFLISLMAFTPGPWCAGCVASHMVNGLLLVAVWINVFTPATVRSAPSPLAGKWSPGIAILLLIAMVVLLNRGRSATIRADNMVLDLTADQRMVDDARKHIAVLLADYQAQPVVEIPSRMRLAPATTHRLVVFTDMQCPACAANALDIDRFIKPSFGDSISIEVRNFPLCRSCNRYADHDVHPDACDAAFAAEAARLMGGQSAFDSMVSALHTHRSDLNASLYDTLAGELHLPLPQFNAVMRSVTVRTTVTDDIELAHSLGVVNTPTLFLDGRQVPDICMTDDFWRAIASASNR